MMDISGEKMSEEKGQVVNSITNKFETLFKYYEKAIEGRNFHYQNYNTWANYYSIFTGALFIGYYTVLNLKDCNVSLFKFLIILIGLITSICWNLTVKGHYHRMLSWIKIVQGYEKELANFLKKNGAQGYFVYSVYAEHGENSFHKNISSQKLTSRFTFSVSIAWAVLLAIYVYNFFFNIKKVLGFYCDSCCIRIVAVLISFADKLDICSKEEAMKLLKKSIFSGKEENRAALEMQYEYWQKDSYSQIRKETNEIEKQLLKEFKEYKDRQKIDKTKEFYDKLLELDSSIFAFDSEQRDLFTRLVSNDYADNLFSMKNKFINMFNAYINSAVCNLSNANEWYSAEIPALKTLEKNVAKKIDECGEVDFLKAQALTNLKYTISLAIRHIQEG